MATSFLRVAFSGRACEAHEQSIRPQFRHHNAQAHGNPPDKAARSVAEQVQLEKLGFLPKKRFGFWPHKAYARSVAALEIHIVILPAGRRLTHRRTAVALALAQELYGAGRHLLAGPVLAVVPRPDARVLAAVLGLAAQLALHKDLLAFVQQLVGGVCHPNAVASSSLPGDPIARKSTKILTAAGGSATMDARQGSGTSFRASVSYAPMTSEAGDPGRAGQLTDRSSRQRKIPCVIWLACWLHCWPSQLAGCGGKNGGLRGSEREKPA